MTEIAQAMPARRLEAIGGALALVAGLTAIGVQIFAPLMTVHVTGVGGNYITQMSRWEVYAGFVSSRLGLAMLGICLLCTLAIGYGAYFHSVRHAAWARLLLWCSTALLALIVVLSMTVFSRGPGSLSTFLPMTLVAPYLLPSLGFALLASGAASA